MSISNSEQYDLLKQVLLTEARDAVMKQFCALTFQENNEGGNSPTTDAIRKDIYKYTVDLNQFFEADVDTITPEMISTIQQLIVDAQTHHMAALDKIEEFY
jgi:hypothetical protein